MFGMKGSALEKQPAVDHEYTFSMFAVRPECQGKGIGTGVLRQLFAERLEPLAGTGATIRVTLMSQIEQNLTLYRRLGFREVAATRVVSDEDVAMDIPNWVMVKMYPVAPSL